MNTKIEWVNTLLSRSSYFQFFISTCLVGVAFALRAVLTPELGSSIPFTFFVSASILSACLGGWKTGVYSMILGFFVASWFFVPPTGTFGSYGKYETISIIANYLPNILAIVGFELLHRLRRTLANAESQLQRAKKQIEQDNVNLDMEVKRRTAELRSSLVFLERFCYSIAHDLRAPLRAIRGFALALQEDYGGRIDSTASEYINRMSQAVVKMDQLITDLLDYGRLSHQELNKADVSLSECVRAGIARFKEQLEELKAEVHYADLNHSVKADRAVLEDVVTRLLSNAIKFRKPNSRLEISISAEKTGEKVKVAFRDNGIGIPSEHVDKIFGMFQTLEPPSGVATGAGLAFISKALERMGGQIGVVSQLGEGSTFWIELPVWLRQADQKQLALHDSRS